MDPTLSIIIPTYQASSTLRKTLESIISQTFKNFEVLIMDGGSTDETRKIAEKYGNDFHQIKFIASPDNGIYDAMNKGIRQAKGEWLFFLGSDDTLFDTDVLACVINCIKLSNSKVIYGNVKVVGDTLWAKDGEIYDGEFTLGKMLLKNICHQAIFYHQSIFKSLGNYNISYRICADYEFNIRSFAKHKFTYLPLTIVYFHAGGHSTLTRDPDFNRDKWIIIARCFGLRLFNSDFYRYTHKLWLTAKTLFLTRNYALFLVVISAYYYHKSFLFKKWRT